MEKPYKPVDCDFHSELTSRSTLGQRAEIVYREDGEEKTVLDYIDDVYSKDGAEYTKLRDGLVLRLDQLVRVDSEART